MATGIARQRLVSGQIWRTFERSTGETTLVEAPRVFLEDFDGIDLVIPAAGSAESGCRWVKKIVGAAPPTIAKKASRGGGAVECVLTVDSQKQDALCYMGDQRTFDLSKNLFVEHRIKVSVLPTLNGIAYWGMMGDWIDGTDNIVYQALFSMRGDGVVKIECDDNATDTAPTSSGTTLIANDEVVTLIDFTDVTNVKYYINGARVGGSLTIPFAATGANAILQPAFGLYKASGAGLGTIECNKVHIFGTR